MRELAEAKAKLAKAGQSRFDLEFDTPENIGIVIADNMSERRFDALVKAAKARYKFKKAKPAG